MKKLIAMMLTLVMALSLAACGQEKTPDVTDDDAADVDAPAEVTYAVEAGSAGEEVALANGFKTVAVGSQADALMEVSSGTSDAAIIDLLMAGAMIGEGTSYSGLACTLRLNSEEYGVGFRKGSDLAALLNDFFKAQAESGALASLAETYGVQEALIA